MKRVLIFMIMTGLLHASPIMVSCQPRTIRLGDVITYRIDIKAPKSTTVDFESNWPSTGNLTLLVVTDSIKKIRTRTYFLSAFTLDKSWVPTLSVRVNTTDYILKPINIKVVSSYKINEQKKFINKLKPQAHISVHWIAYILVGLFITLIGALGVILYRRFVNVPPESSIQVPLSLTPFESAMERLSRLEKAEYLTEESQKHLMFELSHLIREYLERTYHRPFMEETTYEIGFSLPQIISTERTDDVLSFLRLMDPVKYAKESLSSNALKGRIVLLREILTKLETDHGV